MEVLKIDNLSKKYGEATVLKNINMHINEGEIYGLIGRNGAGKTTIMKMILGLTNITSGSIKLWGNSVNSINKSFYSRLGVNLDFQGFYPELSAYENLKVFANIRGITRADAIEHSLEQVGLLREKDKKFKKFSLGMKKRLGLANAIMHEPEFLILDEPTNGLDPIGISEFREYLMAISKNQDITIMISSHLLSELDIMANRIGVLNNGILLAEKTMADIRKINRTHIRLAVTNLELTCGILEKFFQKKNYEVIDEKYIYVYDLDLDREVFSKKLASYGIGILEITEEKGSLEDYFKKLIE